MSSRTPSTAEAALPAQVNALEAALRAGDEERVLALCGAILTFDSRALLESLGAAELHQRRRAHEAVDVALRGFLLADDGASDSWRAWLLPSPVGVLTRPLWIANARWLRASGSNVPDENSERLEPEQLSKLDLVRQAKALGRYCVANDGARAVDVSGLLEVLHHELHPLFCSWLVGTHFNSPGYLTASPAEVHQLEALAAYLEHWSDEPFELPASTQELATVYDAAYREGVDLSALCETVNGRAMTGLVGALRGTAGHTAALDALEPGAHVLIAPNWREDHVSHRCLSPLLEGERQRGAVALLTHEHGTTPPAPPAADWHAIEHQLPGQTHLLVELGALAGELSARKLELAFFPEVLPSNASAWLATQRLARVQATAYGYPVSSGLESMDYFVGGAEVEDVTSAARYSEQLVLLPGFGVSTTPPPAPRTQRVRPVDDERLRLVSTAGYRKLGHAMLDAWDEILRSKSGLSLDLFPAMSVEAARRQGPLMAKHLTHEEVTLHPSVPRLELLDHLVDADLYLDSFPFGGFNTLVEVLTCGCPFVTLEGDAARNRFGAAILRRLELPEFLIARSWRGYIEAATRLLRDAGLRAELRARLADREAVLAALTDANASAHFDAALEWMLAEGPRRGRPGPPVFIEAGQAPRPLAL